MRSRPSRSLAVCPAVLWAIVASGCAAGGPADGGGLLAPSAASAGASSAAVTGPNFDGTGVWTIQPPCGTDCGVQLDLVQDARGDLSLRVCDDCHVDFRLRRLGGRPKTGGIAEYSASMTGLPGDARQCIDMRGSARIDSSVVPNTLTLTLTGQNWHGAGCGAESGTGVFQK